MTANITFPLLVIVSYTRCISYLQVAVINGSRIMTIFDTSHNNRQKWIDEIKALTGEEDDVNAIQFALSFTLQYLDI